MNQAILFNDDYLYLASEKCWRFTGMLSGAKITIYVASDNPTLTNAVKFDLEAQVEDYLEDDEPDEDNVIRL